MITLQDVVHQARTLIIFILVWEVVVTQPRRVQTPDLRPIVGIVAVDRNSSHGDSYIPVSYVSFLQQAGARVVPIRAGQPADYYDRMVDWTNGILLPGGGVPFKTSLFGRSVKYVFDRAVKINRQGDYYPIWGTCMGFQILCYMAMGGVNYLKHTDSRNATWPLNFTQEAKWSRMFRDAPSDVLKYLMLEPVTQNEHQYSILLHTFRSTPLKSFFTALSTNTDRRGQEFVSTIEAKDFPFYGVQWHPEKNNFNWNPHYVINHSDHAVRVSQYMADFFVREARKSKHRFPSVQSEATNMIQNYKRIYFATGTFYENYYFDV